MIDRRLLDNFDWGLLVVTVALSLIGVMTIYSATRPVLNATQKIYYMKQLYWIALSIIAFLVLVSVDYKWFVRYAYLIYAAGIVLLVLVLVAGKKGMGAQRWVYMGPISFQPSEFFKILFIITLSRYLSYFRSRAGLGLKMMLKMVAFFLIVPVALILKQPDLGTALILLFIFTAMILAAGIKRNIILAVLVVSLVSMPFAGKYVWDGLKDYQKQRILTFIDPQADPQGVGYHITQSKVSIGSGGFGGKGYMQGTQGPYRFLPENHTDFIFSIFAEEWGFTGSVVLFFLYFFVIWRGFDTANKTRDRAGCFLALGITYMFSFYFFVNVGMTLGMMPVVGAPLPLMSYGGTALLSNFVALGILENVRMRRFALYY
jgi:rod shape determining protein RodA